MTTLKEAYEAACTLWSTHKDGERSIDRAAKVLARVVAERRALPENIDCASLTFDEVDHAVKWVAMPNGNATRNRYAAAFSAVLKQAKVRGCPVVSLTFAKETGARKDHLTRKESEALMAALDPKWAAVTKALLTTGMRLSELWACLAQPGSYHGNGSFIMLELVSTKNGRPRIVPIPLAVWNDTRRYGYMESDKREYQRAFKAAVDKLWPGRGIVPHSLRHTCATWMTEAGVQLNVVADYLGHKSLTTTRRYAHFSTAPLREALSKIW